LAQNEFTRPDELAVQRVISLYKGCHAEVIIRLAWNLGLFRDEMYNLKWSDISFEEKTVQLPDRIVPMDEETSECLERRSKTKQGQKLEYVVTSDRGYTHLAPQSISRVAKDALNKGGLKGITLLDLRHDYIIRQLEQHDWPYVSRITGIAVATLYACYSEHYTNGRGVPPAKSTTATVDEEKLWAIIEAEGTSPEGLALWMTRALGMQLQESRKLTWDQVDLKKNRIKLPDREIEIDEEFAKRLQRLKDSRSETADPHVLLTPRSQKPFDDARLSRCIRTVLIRGGMENVQFKSLTLDDKAETDELILRRAAGKGSVTRRDVEQLLNLSRVQAHAYLDRLIKKGKLVRVGAKCFPAGTIVPPEEHYEVLRAHLENVGIAYRAELADLLHIEGRQCHVILRKLVEEGKLVRKGQMYSLPK
jgi:integrase